MDPEVDVHALPPVLKRVVEAVARALGAKPGREVFEFHFQDDVKLASYRRLDGPNGSEELREVDEEALHALSEVLIDQARAARLS